MKDGLWLWSDLQPKRNLIKKIDLFGRIIAGKSDMGAEAYRVLGLIVFKFHDKRKHFSGKLETLRRHGRESPENNCC